MDDKEFEPESPVSEDTPTTSKARRQVAFYPNMNQGNKPLKPFSRSAAKRESVMALGSIEHLQHYFTKTGLAAETNPLSGRSSKGMVPAIGGAGATGTLAKLQAASLKFELPPSPIVPQIVQPSFSPHVKTYEVDPENLRPPLIDDLAAVESAWWLGETSQHGLLSVDARGKSTDPDAIDVLDVLRTTTHAVRSVRNYLLSLPDDSTTPVQKNFRSSLPLSRTLVPRRQASQPDLASDPLTRIRRSALEVLGVLRAVEESSRLPLSDDAYDAQSDHGEHASVSGASASGSGSGGNHSRATSPSLSDMDPTVSISYVRVSGKNISVPVWEDEEDFDLNQMSEEEKRDRWEERLVLGGGWLYRQDIHRADLEKEREVIAKYLNAVDEVLFGGRKGGKRGWEQEREKAAKDRRGKNRRASAGDAQLVPSKRNDRRIVSTGMMDAMKAMVLTEETEEPDDLAASEAESLEDDDFPAWAKRTAFEENPYGRLHSLLQALLPASLLPLLPQPPLDRSTLLQALTSGQLLCVAYNIGVRRSRKPWGFISRDSIHDIAALEAQLDDEGERDKEITKRGWTFRRTDNLRLWVAALKLRYELPIVSPPSTSNLTGHGSMTPLEGSTPLSSPTPTLAKKFPRTDEPPITFDAALVARKDPGWEDMLETLVLRWLDVVVDERRGYEPA
ncbi:hypothetical protein BDW22DRAFT_1415373 [Trametopsis cervina]|nr:hypothetical protein BDW22DRAFT_1415373 [Trametopsis cervina]